MTDLTHKQQNFINEYLQCWNATEAARKAGYSGDSVTLASVGYENLRKPHIAEAIQKRLDRKAMSADEALSRLADMARGSLADFYTLTDDGPVLDLKRAREAGKEHLLKKLKIKRKELMGDDGEHVILDVDVDLEIYDAHAALRDILKAHGEFDRHAVGSKSNPLNIMIDDLNAAARQAQEAEEERIHGDSG